MLDRADVLKPVSCVGLNDVTRTGGVETLNLNDGLAVIIRCCRRVENWSTILEGRDLLKFHVQLSGQRMLKFQERHEIALSGAATAILMHDAGVSKLEQLFVDDDERSVTIVINRNRVWEYFEEESTLPPSALHSLITRPVAQPRMAVTIPTEKEKLMAGTIINCRRTGSLRILFIEAKVLELFFLVLDRFQASATGPPRAPRVTGWDRRQLARVHEFLSGEFKAPPTIHKLAREFGMNRNKLCGGFHLLYGESIHDFCCKLRLESARELLTQTDLNLTQIALNSGYGSPSAFSAAFHRHYGEAPSRCRVRHRVELPRP
jgi:AraC-like DNA-binding protein